MGLVVAGAEHGEGESAGRERGFVRGGIDASGEPAGDAHAGAGEDGGEVAGVAQAAGAGPAAADDRDRRMPEPRQVRR